MSNTAAVMTPASAPRAVEAVPAVEVDGLRKDFWRRNKNRNRLGRRVRSASPRCTASPSRCRAARPSPSSARTARASRRWSGSCPRCCCTTAGRRGCSATTSPRDARAVRRLVNRVSVEASFFKKMSAGREPLLRRPVLRDDAAADPRRDPGDPRPGRLPGRRGAHEPMENLSRGMQQKVALARALLTVAGAAAARRADHRPRPAVEARGAGLRPGDPGRARRHDPALHARHGRGRGAGRPGRHHRPRPAHRAGAGRAS